MPSKVAGRRYVHTAERVVQKPSGHLADVISSGHLGQVSGGEWLPLLNWVTALATASTDHKFSFKRQPASVAEQRCFTGPSSLVWGSWQKIKRAGEERIEPFKFLITYHFHQGQGSVYLLNDLSGCSSVPSPWGIGKESLQVTAETETERIYGQWKGRLPSWTMS